MRRGVLLLLVLGGVLAGMVGLNQIITRWHYILSGDPGDLLYVASFDGFADEWEQFDDGQQRAQVIDGALTLHAGTPQKAAFSFSKPYFADFDARIHIQSVDGPLDNGYGLTFRQYDRENYYYFLISSDGWYRVKRLVKGQEKIISNWTPSPLVRQGHGQSNELRVMAYQNRFQFFINGEQVPLCIPNNPDGISTPIEGECRDGKWLDTLVDDAIQQGHIGAIIEVDQGQQPGVVVRYDDLVVFGSQAIPEETAP